MLLLLCYLLLLEIVTALVVVAELVILVVVKVTTEAEVNKQKLIYQNLHFEKLTMFLITVCIF